jgi:nitrite reductase/ring-hydroxylating ferredoxin subunit
MSIEQEDIKVNLKGFAGHGLIHSNDPDDEITLVGPGTPAGEYLRRYWQPVFISSELDDLPVAIKILGEELVLFRDQSLQLGLVHKHCPHRQASLEFGICQKTGISCCYHGWHFDVDGSCDDGDTTPWGEVALSFDNETVSSIDLKFTSNVNIYGFQFTVNGVELIGVANDAGLMTQFYG